MWCWRHLDVMDAPRAPRTWLLYKDFPYDLCKEREHTPAYGRASTYAHQQSGLQSFGALEARLLRSAFVRDKQSHRLPLSCREITNGSFASGKTSHQPNARVPRPTFSIGRIQRSPIQRPARVRLEILGDLRRKAIRRDDYVDVILPDVRRKQLPATILTDRGDRAENNRAPGFIQKVGRLCHLISLELQQLMLVGAQPGSNPIVVAIDRAPRIAVKMRTVTGKCNQIGRQKLKWLRDAENLTPGSVRKERTPLLSRLNYDGFFRRDLEGVRRDNIVQTNELRLFAQSARSADSGPRVHG